jgi:hypothetical protein
MDWRFDMKIPNAEQERRPWRIHDLVPDFVLEDVWALPMRGGPDDFDAMLDMVRRFDPAKVRSRPARLLWSLRDRLGRWLDLGEISSSVDAQGPASLPIPGGKERSLRERLPSDLRGTASDFSFDALPFVPLYRTDREAAAEVSNKTVHGVAHLTWVAVGEGEYEGRMAVYVKPRGLFGRAYMAAIKPFRYTVVYPAILGEVGRAWESRASSSPTQRPVRRDGR